MPRLFVLLALLLLSGCRREATLREEDERFARALVALHIADSRHVRVGDVSPTLRDSLLALHGFTRTTFQEKLLRLSRDLPRYRLVYGVVEEELSLAVVADTAQGVLQDTLP